MEERVNKLEKITARLMRRAGKRMSAFITPYPISNAVFGEKLEGPVLRYMFPCDGTITKGYIRLGNKPKKSIAFEIRMFNEDASTTKGFTVDKRFLFVKPEIPVFAGDCLEIKISPDEEIVTEVWIAFLWKPTVNNTEVKDFLIEEMENDLQKRKKSLTE